MNKLQEMQVDFAAARLYEGACSGDTGLIDSLLRMIPDEQIHHVYNQVVNNLSHDINAQDLDVIFKRKYEASRFKLRRVYSQVQSFNCERNRIDQTLTGYPKYQATMALFGRDPLSYHEWADLMIDYQQVN